MPIFGRGCCKKRNVGDVAYHFPRGSRRLAPHDDLELHLVSREAAGKWVRAQAARSGSRTHEARLPLALATFLPLGAQCGSARLKIEPVEVHYFGPHHDEFIYEFRLGVVGRIHFGDGA